jgi:DNA-binding MarR family transcriptional regulator
MKADTSHAHDGILEERRSSPGLLLALLGREAMHRLREAHAAVDLAPRHFQLLALLHDQGPLGQRELGREMGVEPSVLVTLLNPLEIRGYVARERRLDDRRRHTVSITAAGETKLVEATEAQRDVEDEYFSSLSAAQREQLASLLLVLQNGRDLADCPPTEGRISR